MKANELRIGNFYDNNGFVSVVSPNTIEEVWNAERSWVKPIPLTEEWLLKFGFVIHEDGYITCPNGRQWILHLDNEFEFEALNIIVIYVHQLQNLYFALTGEELIKTN